MIPLSVRMTGWMRYRDEQVADFRGGPLIAICGENGAGKSSIFDAITFALYGQHRLGAQGTGDLVSQDRDRLSVEFEFEAEGERYLVRRSRTRKGGEGDQGLWVWDEAAGDWTPVPGTEKEGALDRTLANILRMTPAAFTSSFLLRQGAATEFLDARPKPRFDIVSSLIGLKEYEALEKAARDAGRLEDARVKDLTARLAEFVGIDEGAVEGLRGALACAKQREGDESRVLLAARALLADAQRFTRLNDEACALTGQIEAAGALVAQKAQVEKDADHFEKISGAVEKVGRIEAALADASRAEAAAEQARGQATAIDAEALARAYADAGRAAKAAEKHARTAEREHAAAAQAEREAHDFATLSESILTGRRAVDGCDARIKAYETQLATLPALEAEATSLMAVVTALPALRVLKEAREHLEKVGKGHPEVALRSLVARKKTLDAEAKRWDRLAATAEKDVAAMQAAAADCRAAVATLDAELKQRRAAAAEATCSRCGQPVDKKHARLEVERAMAEAREAKGRLAAAVKDERAAEAALAAARDAQKSAVGAVAALEREITAAESRRDEHARAGKAFAAVAPPELAAKVGAASTAAAITKVIAAHGDAPKHADRAAKAVQQLHGLEGERSAAVAERERAATAVAAGEAKLNGRLKDVPAAKAAHEAASAKLRAASAALAAARDETESARAAEAQAREALESAGKQRAELETEAKQRAEEAAGHRRAAVAFATDLGELTQLALDDPSRMLTTLRAQQRDLVGAPGRKAALDVALRDQIVWEAQRSAKLDEIASIPEQHRVDEPVARGALAEAEAAATAASAAREDAQRQLATAEARLEQLAGMQAERTAAEARARLLKTLVRLLGKGGLQGALVNGALNAIASHANAFLQRLTGGSLRLTLEQRGGDALELQAIDATCMREPRSVQVLSGSQKFRCAVAVASGIGQHAGAGGMRSIVIDEGFGSLDASGQTLMVEELKNLSMHMDKVIVVSHLEAFADRSNFPDQILVTREGEGSRIERK